jgi:hypothetical protein
MREVGTREHRSITEKGILRRVSKLVSNFKEANKKLKIVLGSEKKYPSRDTVLYL